jgi:hypothetical protein
VLFVELAGDARLLVSQEIPALDALAPSTRASRTTSDVSCPGAEAVSRRE